MKKQLLFTITLLISMVMNSQIANTPNPLEICDDETPDETALFNLTVSELEILGSQNASDYIISYYTSSSDADNEVNPITNTTSYANILNPQTLFVRLEEVSTGNYDTAPLTIRVLPTPEGALSTPIDLTVCDDNTDGIAIFDLTINEGNINPSGEPFTFTYYTNESDALLGMNAISNPTNFANTSAPQIIFVRVENIYNCFSLTTFGINATPIPTPSQNLAELQICDDNNDGFAQFDLTANEVQIVSGEADVEVSYFETISDAASNVNPLFDAAQYTNITNPQVIYARVENFNTGCFAVTNFDILVQPIPVFNLDNDYEACIGETLILDTELNSTNFDFLWEKDDVLISGETDSSIVITEDGNYSVTVTGFEGNTICSFTDVTIVSFIVCIDTDSDGIIDSEEDINLNGNLDDDDTDMDNIPNYLDDDDDGDNVDTIIEISISTGRSINSIHPFVDTDGDLIENYLDDDDDGDMVLTRDEDYNNNGDPTDDDTNMNGTPDYLDSDVALSLNEFDNVQFSMFPNPANDLVTIRLNANNFGNVTVNIIDLQGKLILEQHISEGNTMELDIADLQSGLYFVKLNANNKSLIKKLIIE